MKSKKWQMWLWGILQADMHIWAPFKTFNIPIPWALGAGLALCTWGATLIQITHMLHVCNLTLPGHLPANSTLLSFLPNANSGTCFPPFQSLRKIWSVKSVAELPLTSVRLGVKLSAYETCTFLFRKLSNIAKGSFQSFSSPKCSVKVLHFSLY